MYEASNLRELASWADAAATEAEAMLADVIASPWGMLGVEDAPKAN
jgi:uncharacterized protein YciI